MGQEVCQTSSVLCTICISVPHHHHLLPLLLLLLLLSLSFYSDMYLILSHFLCSHLLTLLLSTSSLISSSACPQSLPPPPHQSQIGSRLSNGRQLLAMFRFPGKTACNIEILISLWSSLVFSHEMPKRGRQHPVFNRHKY